MRKPYQSPGQDEKLILLYCPGRGLNSRPPAHRSFKHGVPRRACCLWAHIDLFLVTNNCSVCNVKAISSVSLHSDHRLIVMQTRYTIKNIKPAEKKKRVNLRNLANGENMRKESQEQITRKTVKPLPRRT